MSHLKDLESKSIYIIREAYSKFRNPAVLWSIGKDSTALLWLCRKSFYGKIPFKVMHLDTGYKFNEIYNFREKYSRLWGIDLVVSKNEDSDKKGIVPEKGRFECCNSRKTIALQQAVEKNDFDALLVGIRRDEHAIRGKERYFSPRDRKFRWNIFKKDNGGDSGLKAMQDTELSGWNLFATDFGPDTDHVRVHPLLHWTELDIWEYIKQENIPVVSLYFSKNGRRYRSIGCEPCCMPMDSSADSVEKIIAELRKTKIPERAGRAQDKEDSYNMQKLRSLGYM